MATQVVPTWPADDIDTLFVPSPRLNVMPNALMNAEVQQTLNEDNRERLNENNGAGSPKAYYDKVYGTYYDQYDNPYDELV
jgi:hypothetical protein